MNVVAKIAASVFVLLTAAICTIAAHAADVETAKPKPVGASRIQDLIKGLGADDYFAREKAQSELVEIGAEAFDALSEAADRARDVEVSERLAYLLRTIKVRWVEKSDPNEVRALLQNYEGMSEQDRREAIDALAALPGVTPLAALCRILRFEPSQPLSKMAALRIIEQKPAADDDPKKRRDALEAGIGGSPRSAADWVRKSLGERDDPAATAEAFAALIDAEDRVLRQYPHRSKPEILMSLLRRQAALYKQLDRPQEMVAALVRMVGFEQGGNVVLNEVLQTLTERKDWAALDRLVERFPDRLQQDPLTSYIAARAYQVQGNAETAERFASQARGMSPGDQRKHIVLGIDLRNRGWIEWAEAEYRESIKMGTPTQALTLIAQFQLGESLHDRAQDLDAAKVLDEASKGMEAAAGQGLDVSDAGRGIDANRARAHFFYAVHYKQQKDAKKTLQHLLEGLADDQHDAEILIDLFHVPDLDATVRDRVRKLIREAAEIERKRIADHPEDDTPYNQLAWLISNTEGDFNEALEASKKSLELKPEGAGHMDTLARCHYAAGDFENAVTWQKKAIDLDPHSQQMKRQLKLFEEALAKKQKTK